MKVDLPSWSVRNPLGTIALFISLIYGVSALLLGTSLNSLTEANQTVLVVFIALFPVLILSVFAWLVSTHHKKLYGPGDYRTDEGFLQAAATSPPDQVGFKLQEELTSELEGVPATPPQIGQAPQESGSSGAGGQLPNETVHPQEGRWKSGVGTADLIQRAYFAESLAFQELQRRFDGTVKRNVNIPTTNHLLRLDGILSTAGGEFAVEIALLRKRFSIHARLRKTADFVRQAQEALPSMRIMVVLVVDDAELDVATALSAARRVLGETSNVELAAFDLQELALKYGFPPELATQHIGISDGTNPS